MKKIIIITFILVSIISKSQNLVPNGGFEDTVQCGAAWYPITNALGWNGFRTVDYFNSCVVPSGSFITDVPVNFFGFQYAKKGEGYIGLLTHEYYNLREYAYRQLSQQLQTNKNYCVSFNVALSQSSTWATNRIGAFLSNDTLDPEPFVPDGSGPPWSIFTYYIPQVEDSTFITDTAGWTNVSGVIQATGNENFITLGNFRDDNQTDTLRVATHPGGTYSYYYLDEVYVEEVVNAKAGNDSSFYVNDSIQLGNNPTENATYYWFPTIGLSDPNSPNPKASPNSTTTYVVTKTQCNVITTDTVTLTSLGVGINEKGIKKGINLYPNPSTGKITLECKLQETEAGMLRIYNLTGNLVGSYKLAVGSQVEIINAENLNPGMYQYEVIINGKQVQREKLVIIK